MSRTNKIFLIYLSCIIPIFMILFFGVGKGLDFYDRVHLYDKFLHFFFSSLVLVVIGFWLAHIAGMKPFWAAFFAFCFALMIGVMWEIVEYVLDVLRASNNERWRNTVPFNMILTKYASNAAKQGPAAVDTMGDLISGTIGAFIASMAGWLWLARAHKRKDSAD